MTWKLRQDITAHKCGYCEQNTLVYWTNEEEIACDKCLRKEHPYVFWGRKETNTGDLFDDLD